MSTQPPYKEYQYLYRELVEEHDDAIDKVPSVVTENTLEEKLRGAMAYFEAQSFPIIYPGKSYVWLWCTPITSCVITTFQYLRR